MPKKFGPLIAVLLVVALQATATPMLQSLTPGAPAVTIPNATGFNPGSLLDAVSSPYLSSTSSISGTVLTDADSNPLGLVTQTFIDTNASSPDPVGSYSIALNPAFNYLIGFTTAFGGTDAPGTASLSPSFVLTVFWNLGQLGGGGSAVMSDDVLVQALNATTYQSANISLLDSLSASGKTLDAAVPEPGAMSLVFCGLLALAFSARHRLTGGKI